MAKKKVAAVESTEIETEEATELEENTPVLVYNHTERDITLAKGEISVTVPSRRLDETEDLKPGQPKIQRFIPGVATVDSSFLDSLDGHPVISHLFSSGELSR